MGVPLIRAARGVALYCLLAALAAAMLGPLLWMLGTSLKTSGEVFSRAYSPLPSRPQIVNYAVLFSKVPFHAYFLNTLKISAFACAGTLLTSSMAAYAFARLQFPGRDLLFLLYLGTLMVPRQVVLIPNFVLFRAFGLIDTHMALILTGTFTAYGTFLLRQFFLTIPQELEEAAVMDGYGYARRFGQIILPLAKPGLTTLFILTLLAIWNEYLYALIFINTDTKRTLTLGLAILRGDFDVQWNLVMAGTTISVLPLVVVYILLQRFFVEGIALAGLKA